MKQIRIILETNETQISDIFELESYASNLIIDYTGTGVEDWDKFVDIETGDGKKYQIELGKEVTPFRPISNLFTVKGTLLINPIAKMKDGDRTRVHAFKTFKFDVQETVNTYGEGSANKEDVIYPILTDIEDLKKRDKEIEAVHASDVARLDAKDVIQDDAHNKLKEEYERTVFFVGTINKRLTQAEDDIELLKQAEIGEIAQHVNQINKNKDDIGDLQANDRYQDKKITEFLEEARKDNSASAMIFVENTEGVSHKEELKLTDFKNIVGDDFYFDAKKNALVVKRSGTYMIDLNTRNRLDKEGSSGYVSIAYKVNDREVAETVDYVDKSVERFTTLVLNDTINLMKGDEIKITTGVIGGTATVQTVSGRSRLYISRLSPANSLKVEYLTPASLEDIRKNREDLDDLADHTLGKPIKTGDGIMADLNNLKEQGLFYVENADQANSIKNIPEKAFAGFTLEVTNVGRRAYQIYRSLSSVKSRTYFRNFDVVWSKWIEMADVKDLEDSINGEEIPKNSDLDDYRTPGRYFLIMTNDASSIKNCPTDRAFVMNVYLRNPRGSEVVQDITTHDGRYKYSRGSNTGNWGAWVEYATQSSVDKKTDFVGTGGVHTFAGHFTHRGDKTWYPKPLDKEQIPFQGNGVMYWNVVSGGGVLREVWRAQLTFYEGEAKIVSQELIYDGGGGFNAELYTISGGRVEFELKARFWHRVQWTGVIGEFVYKQGE